MSCACEHKQMDSDLERMRRMAKACARLEGATMAIYRKSDGTYGIERESGETDKMIVEYITQY